MVSDEEPASNRRQLLGAAAAAAGLATVEFVSACGSSSRLHVGKIPPAADQSDVDHLNYALGLKHYAVAAYTAATPLLKGREHAAAKRFLGQDLAHVSQLISLINHIGGTPNPPRANYDLGHPSGTRALLELLDTAENDTIAGFLQLAPNVSPGVVRAELCAILANDAQHVAVLRLALRRNPIPVAFVTGRD